VSSSSLTGLTGGSTTGLTTGLVTGRTTGRTIFFIPFINLPFYPPLPAGAAGGYLYFLNNTLFVFNGSGKNFSLLIVQGKTFS